ncbi:retrovirus-related Pol polyprotein from transposon 412 [Trichonephila clavipes]|nr:retrovirus-related Pol polyprotein from transposon 412 [Trichonephila clavipes]
MPVQLGRGQRYSRGKLHRYNVGAPFERIAFDILGPLPRTVSGNKYLLVVMDYFTKWPEVYPIRIRKPPPCGGCSAALDIEIWGTSSTSFSQGRNFVSLKEVCELLGIDKTKTTPLHPQSDGMVERFNRTILNNLSLMVSRTNKTGTRKVPLFLLAYFTRLPDIHHPRCFWRDVSLVTCCLVALRIHLHRLRGVRAESPGTF